LTSRYKARFNRALDPLGRALHALGCSPTALTVTGLVLVAASCGYLLLTERLLPFCGLVTLATLCDALDGAVARAGGRETKWGAYLDAMADRYGEGMVILSVAAVTGTWLLSSLVLFGALLVSYAKARAAMEVAVTNQEWPDLMERTERGVLYVAGLAASQLVTWRPLGRDLFWWTLAGLATLIHWTVWQRMIRARKLILQRR
jgi:phosphatidylglycerophosphate synthase